MAATEISPLVRQQLYTPIAPWQIRLLKIQPSSDLYAEVICDLVKADLITFAGVGLADGSEIIQYEALSYSWGYPVLSQRLRCNGLSLPVSQTMYDVLRHLRYSNEPRFLWTDVCCINQENLSEKAIQVGMMFTIFRKAFRVVSWLGMPSKNDELLFQVIEGTDRYDRIDDKVYSLTKAPDEESYHRGHYEQNLSLLRDAAWQTVTSRPFFRRTWIRQEFFAARQMEVVCGKYKFSFRQFANVIDQLLPDQATSRERITHLNDPDSRALLCYSYFRDDFESGVMHETRVRDEVWFNTIMRGTIYQATLPQDKVFAVLGIAAEQTKEVGDPKLETEDWDITMELPKIDYRKSVSHVYQEFVKHTINNSRSLKILSIFQDMKANGNDIPSWVIDLRVDVPRYLIPQQMMYWGRDYAEELAEQSFDNLDLLRLRGRRIAIVQRDRLPLTESQSFFKCFTGNSSPMLLNCLSKESWFPEEDSEYDGQHRDSGSLLNHTIQHLQKQCAYDWREINPGTLKGGEIVPTEPLHWEESKEPQKLKKKYFVFASNAAQQDDLIVHLSGAEVPCLLRMSSTEEKCYSFVGPVLLAVGYFSQSQLVRFALASVEYKRDGEVQSFTLV